MEGQVPWDLGKQVQRLSLAEEALKGDRRDLLGEAASAPAIAGCFPRNWLRLPVLEETRPLWARSPSPTPCSPLPPLPSIPGPSVNRGVGCSRSQGGVELQLPRAPVHLPPFRLSRKQGIGPRLQQSIFLCAMCICCLHLGWPGFRQLEERAVALAREGV